MAGHNCDQLRLSLSGLTALAFLAFCAVKVEAWGYHGARSLPGLGRRVVAGTSFDLLSALEDPSIDRIVLTGDLVLDKRVFSSDSEVRRKTFRAQRASFWSCFLLI